MRYYCYIYYVIYQNYIYKRSRYYCYLPGCVISYYIILGYVISYHCYIYIVRYYILYVHCVLSLMHSTSPNNRYNYDYPYSVFTNNEKKRGQKEFMGTANSTISSRRPSHVNKQLFHCLIFNNVMTSRGASVSGRSER